MNLVICGNGMDLHLGFKTSYQNYRDFLRTEQFINGKTAISLIENSIFLMNKEADCWSDLEKTLTFDCEKFIEEILYAFDRDISPYDENQSKSQMHAAKMFIEESPVKIARSFTNDWFYNWIANEYYNRVDRVKNRYKGIMKDLIREDDIFINFNYTPSLEDVFKIDKKNILYIHNRFPRKPQFPFSYEDLLQGIVESGKKKFQFGSPENKLEKWEELLSKIKLKSKGQLCNKEMIERDVMDIYYSFSKDLSYNYDSLKKFISSSSVESVIILGHSILGIDTPYYEEILIPAFKEKNWIITWHDNDINAKKFIANYSITSYNLIEW